MHARSRIAPGLLIAAIAIALIGCTPVTNQATVGDSGDAGAAPAAEASATGTTGTGATSLAIPVSTPAPYTPPPLPPGPRFEHPSHIERGVACEDCHVPGAPPEKWAEPMFEMCMLCHEELEEEWPAEKRIVGTFWSPGGDPLWARASTPLGSERNFAHESHSELECSNCHGDMAPATRRGGLVKTMRDCMDCHEARGAPNSCATCHKEIREGTKPTSHADSWQQRHGGIVAASGGGLPNDCARCHTTQQFCTSCHEGGQAKPASHASGWLQRHGGLVRGSGVSLPTDCRMCHTTEESCTSCHEGGGAKPESHADRWLQRHGGIVKAAGGGLPTDCRMCHTTQESCTSCHEGGDAKPASHAQLWLQRHGGIVMAAGGGVPTDCRQCHTSEAFCTSCHKDELPDNHTNLWRTRTHGVMVSLDRTRCMVCHETDSCQQCHEATPPRSHRGNWASGRNSHCGSCHIPVTSEGQCRICHQENPVHLTAPEQPSWHEPGFNCRLCHTTFGTQGAPPLRHLDNGLQCQLCHR